MAKKKRKKKRSRPRPVEKRKPESAPSENIPEAPQRESEPSSNDQVTVHSLPPADDGKKSQRSIFFLAVGALLILVILLLIIQPALIKSLFIQPEPVDVAFHSDVRLASRFGQMRSYRDVRYTDFVGSDSCMLCHIEQYSLWRNSTHGRAGGDPGNVKVVARFDDQPLQFKDATVIPSITEDEEYILIVREPGKPELIVRVDGIVGGGHMEGGGTQCFFARAPDGTLRFVPFDYNRTDDVWFVQLSDDRWVPITEDISINNLANWPPHRILGTQDKFSNCQNCHGSQILVEYDTKEGKYITRYTTLEINCESCHGPGRTHIDLMRTADLDTLIDIGIIHLTTVTKDESLNKCFECHAEKAALTNEYLSGMPLESHFALKFPLLASVPFQPDGRVRTFAYQQNHLFSDCYINGSMTCVDCHDPHSQEYRDVYFNTLRGKFDDGQCTDCHPIKAYRPEDHSYHMSDSPGNVCCWCHMPFLQHPNLGPAVRFARSDHIIPIPRPEFDAQQGIENACQQCHRDESLSWQQQKSDEWYRSIKPHNQLITNNISAKNITDIETAADLLLNPDVHFPMAQVNGLFDFIKRFLKPNMTSLNLEIIEKLKQLADKSDLDVKALALVALHLSLAQREDIHEFLMEQLQASDDQEKSLRNRWTFAMDYVGTLFTYNSDYANAILTHKKALEIKPEDAYTLFNLGIAYKSIRSYSDAISSFKNAIEIEPANANTYFQLAHTYTMTRQNNEAIQILEQGLKYDPNNQNANQMLRQLKAQ